MKEILSKVESAMKILFDIDCTNYHLKLDNQKRINRAYTELEKAKELIKNYE